MVTGRISVVVVAISAILGPLAVYDDALSAPRFPRLSSSGPTT
jgi:hypothetical protein